MSWAVTPPLQDGQDRAQSSGVDSLQIPDSEHEYRYCSNRESVRRCWPALALFGPTRVLFFALSYSCFGLISPVLSVYSARD